MFYIKYDGEYVFNLVISTWEDEEGYTHFDNYLLTDENKTYAYEFETEDLAFVFIDRILASVYYIDREDLTVVGGNYAEVLY